MNSRLRVWLSRLATFWGREERQVLGLNLALHTAVQVLALQFMPLPYYSRLSTHDGNTYYRISENLWSQRPIALLSWHKRILLPVLANIVFPWNKEISFLIIGIAAASLSTVFFYKVAAKYANHAFQLTVLYSVLPWLLFAAHHGLNEPLMMLFLLAGYYYYLQGRDWTSAACISLAILSKELAALPALAMGILYVRRHGWRRALVFATALLPVAVFAIAYGIRWGNMWWYLQESAGTEIESYLSFSTPFYWMYWTLVNGTQSSANPTVALVYDVLGQALNVVVLASTAVGVYLLGRTNPDLALLNLISIVPLWFLGRNQYMLNSSLGRQFLIASTTILAYDRWVKDGSRGWRVLFSMAIVAMLLVGMLWVILYSKFFLFYKIV